MRNLFATTIGVFIVGLTLSVGAFAQAPGDYRSATSGDWSEAATWQEFDGGAWIGAADAPTGSETITIAGEDSINVDVAVSITGLVRVMESGELAVGDGSLEFADGGTYEHARDGGDLPSAEWSEGSTYLLTGTVQDAPGDRNQDFHHVTVNTPELGRNRDLGLDGVTIGGDMRFLSTGANRWQLTSAGGGESATITILGDVVVVDGQVAVQGTGNAQTEFVVHHYGDILVTGGNFSAARGSQGSGSGTTTWYLYGGDFEIYDAATQNSNPTPGNAKYVFAGGGTQQLTFDNVSYSGGQIHFEVSDSSTVEITEDFELNGLLVNRGEVVPMGEFVVTDGGVYEHARNEGVVPTATWEEGSTARFTGVTTDAPENRGQDYHHLELNTPGQLSNLHMSLTDHTISGDIRVIDTGSARWYLTSASSEESATVTLLGDVLVENGQFAAQGTGSALTTFVVHHYGDINVTGGNFSIGRGSQGSGSGTTTWYLYEGDFSMSNARTQNSNPTPGNAKFVFAADSVQHLNLGGENEIDNLSIEVSDSTTLDLGTSEIGGSGVFIAQDGASLVTAHEEGLAGNLQTSGDISLGQLGGITFSGELQFTGALFPDSLQTLTVSEGATLFVSDSTYASALRVDENATLIVDTTASITVGGGTIEGFVTNRGEFVSESVLDFGPASVYQHDRNAGELPSGNWAEGSSLDMRGTTDEAPDNSNQDFYNVTFNTPNLSANRHMSFDDVTIGGDIHVANTGSARWYLTSASPEDTSIVTIMGDVVVTDGQFSAQGTGNALTTFIVHHYGDVVVTGGNFSIARGSQSGAGTTTWYMHEGDFGIVNARTQNSNSTPGNAKFVFDADGVQDLLIAGDEAQIDNLPIEVSSGTTLDVGSSEVTGGDIFVLNGGATLATAHPGGIAGAVQTTGDVSLSEEANFTFNGEDEQVTSELMPTTVNDVVIDNEAGVTLSQETTINGVLLLAAGEFDNTIPFTMGPDGEIVREGGSLTVTTSTEPVADLPTEFKLHQNYPNPFNPSTVIQYDIKERADVTVTIFDVAGRAVQELVRKEHAPGTYQVEWNAAGQASGVYFYQIRTGVWSATRSLLLVK